MPIGRTTIEEEDVSILDHVWTIKVEYLDTCASQERFKKVKIEDTYNGLDNIYIYILTKESKS